MAIAYAPTNEAERELDIPVDKGEPAKVRVRVEAQPNPTTNTPKTVLDEARSRAFDQLIARNREKFEKLAEVERLHPDEPVRLLRHQALQDE